MFMEVKTTKVSSKGQVVIPLDVRQTAGLNTGDVLLVYGEKDTVMLKKIRRPNLKQEFLELFKRVNKKIKDLGLTEEDIMRASEEVRHGSKSSP
ncbi:MAG: AbrB/MazE/SpoVT family DNA-binding domain-containing protein [Methanocellales archaeon]|nr:AbrB/MazE/SpoVT family DNA-binding domain-containing protein [Methanocellales archaeon]